MHLIRTIVGLMDVRCRRRALFGFLSAIANACHTYTVRGRPMVNQSWVGGLYHTPCISHARWALGLLKITARMPMQSIAIRPWSASVRVRRYQTILDVLNGDDPLYEGAEVSRRDIVTMLAGFARVYAPNQVPT
jgi:hypothetical protein